MTEDTPKACPWCTGVTKLWSTVSHADETWVQCDECGARGPAEEAEDEAILQWNRMELR